MNRSSSAWLSSAARLGQRLRAFWPRSKRMRSALLVLSLFGFCALFAEFLASPKAIVAQTREGTFFFDNLKSDPPTRVDTTFRWMPFVPYAPDERASPAFEPASRLHPLGTDSQGRDVFAGIVHGSRVSLVEAFFAAALAVALGTFLGALAGFFGGLLDATLARITEVLSSIPAIFLVLAVQSFLSRPSISTMLLAIVLTRWAEVARVVRTQVLELVSSDFVLAARALGASRRGILLRHVFPHLWPQIWVALAFAWSSVVLVESACDYLHLGAANHVSWATLLAGDGQKSAVLTAARSPGNALAFWAPAICLLVVVLVQNLLAEALRERASPRN
jgi:peptide/nickel transport system permease protein